MFRKAVSIPAFSRANDISRDDVLEMVFSLRIEDALAQLRRAYPTRFPQIGDFAVDAPSDYPDAESAGDQQIRRDFIERSEEHTSELQYLMRTSSTVICSKKKLQYTIHINTA